MKPLYKVNNLVRKNGNIPLINLFQPYRRSIFQRMLCYIPVFQYLVRQPSTSIAFKDSKAVTFTINSNTVWHIDQTPTTGNAGCYKFSIVTGHGTKKVTIYRVPNTTPSTTTIFTIRFGKPVDTNTLRINYTA